MKRRISMLFLALLLIFSLGSIQHSVSRAKDNHQNGANNKTTAQTDQPSQKDEQESIPSSQTDEPQSGQPSQTDERRNSQPAPKDERQNSCSFESSEQLMDTLHTSLTKEEIIDIFGSHYDEVTSAMDNEKMWRFNLCASPGYQSELDYEDAVDLEALSNGNLKYVIYFTFNKEDAAIDNVSLYYKDQKTGSVYEYREYPDGYTKNLMIYP